jgi:tyrosyl-tRNA synthetase
MQGYDSVMIDADVELGATEQKFNLVIARQIQKEYGKEQQIVLTLPVLEGIDGTQRMSKSLGNYIGIDEAANETYGKVMSIQDTMIYPYFELVTDVGLKELHDIKMQLQDQDKNPRDIKKNLAHTLTRMYHGLEAAKDAESEFERIFVQRKLPQEVQNFAFDKKVYRLDELLINTNTAVSKSEARRLIEQGGVTINGDKISDPFAEISLEKEVILKVGKRRFAKVSYNKRSKQ